MKKLLLLAVIVARTAKLPKKPAPFVATLVTPEELRRQERQETRSHAQEEAPPRKRISEKIPSSATTETALSLTFQKNPESISLLILAAARWEMWTMTET